MTETNRNGGSILMIRRIFLVGIILLGYCVHASDNVSPERRDRSFQVFAKGIDTLLIETDHVFVQRSDHVQGFYLEGAGAIFTGRISLTGSTNINFYIGDWIKWFKETANKNDDTDTDEKKDGTRRSGTNHSGASKKNGNHFKTLHEEDEKRLQDINMHVKAFLQELIGTMTDYGPILKGLSGNDRVVVVLFVKDREFKDTYHDNKLMVTIPFKRFGTLQNLDPDDPSLIKAFTVNIEL